MNKFIRGCLMAVIIAGFIACGTTSTTTTTTTISWDAGLTTGVTRITEDGIQKGTLSVSPDGTKLLYSESAKGAWNIVYLRDANNPAKTPLISDGAFDPSWYPDNSQFLYISYEGERGRIVRSSIIGGSRVYITRNPIGDSDRFPSIKNGLIVCSSSSNGKWQLVTVKENGTEPTFLGEGWAPSWHPTQNKIVFIRNGDIYEMDMSPNNLGQVTVIYSDPQFACFTPSYSADGKKILFSMGTYAKATSIATTEKTTFFGNLFGGIFSSKTSKSKKEKVVEVERTNLFVINADGSNRTSSLNAGTASVSSPCWGKNNEIFCLVDTGKGKEIYKLRLKD